MILLTNQIELQNEFRRLIKQYQQFFWATAWAGESPILDDLIKNKDKIKKIAVGIHFYQTHPKFIEKFLEDDKVRFIQQPDGTFHPKLYLFFNTEDSWEVIIGSANFTLPAFTKNTEATILLTSKDSNSKDILKNAIKLVENSWKSAEVFNEKKLDLYTITWKNQRTKINSLSGQYSLLEKYGSKKRNPKPIHEIPIINRSWKEFMNGVRNDEIHSLEIRIKVIEISRMLFTEEKHFKDLSEDKRKFIAGIPNKLNVDDSDIWAYFGSMKGAGIYKNKIKENDENISKALDQIPKTGQITKSHYDKFLYYFTKTFKGNYLGTATRLLAMKRPDIFVCLDSKNKSALCKDFKIKQADMDYERYWEDIIERIYDSEWWQNPDPKSEEEIKVSEARAAFLDCIYYNE
jgi:hypothetical protein